MLSRRAKSNKGFLRVANLLDDVTMSLSDSGLKRRADRAIERQLAYQQAKAQRLSGHEAAKIAQMQAHSAEIRAKLEAVRPIAADARVLEVGCGAHGLIFFFGSENGVGVDPLADHYRTLFPAWQHRAKTYAASGETLPFADGSFDVVLCDNVVDHAHDPAQILREISRVMAPGALLFFEVNVHHPLYHVAASVHAGWRALGIPFEITPFADHTYHYTLPAARRLFEGLPLDLVQERDTVAEESVRQRNAPRRRTSDLLKRHFFKNAMYEVIAVKRPA
jgi:SAM-dependent methyltransferase